GSALVFVLSMSILLFIKTEFVPSMDQGRLLLRVKLPVGTSLEKTSSILKKAEAVTDVHPAIKSAVVAIGGFRGGESNSAMMFMMMHSHGERPLHPETGNAWTQEQLAADLRTKLGKVDPELKVIIQDLSQRNFSVSRGFPVEFSVRGSDWQKLGEYSEQIAEKMKASGFTRDVDTTYLEGQPELRIEPNRAAANLRGVSMLAIGNTISSLVGGRKIGQYSKDGRRYDIRLRLQEQYRLTADAIRKLSVRNYTGELVSLSEVVKIEQRPALQSITRENRERSITISANPGQGITQNEALVKSLEIARSVLPAGYSAVISGSSTAADAAFNGLVFSLVLGIVLAYMILGSQFNSFLHPVTVLLAMPFSFTGAFFALWLTGISLNIYSFIGLILLMGLVKKNSILLVEFTNQLRKRGEPAREALLEACPVRLRPIMMTSIATIAAAIPPALALGPGAESARAMAVTILGGMIFSTFLTLIIVPAAYLVFTRFERKTSA
ncbi:MAG: efflux RND transporter permease subunit, partial [Leptospiraceae bacterium]|nr:efflux RND transporter permease subunit [Leptospiraceae bacterium]